MATNDQDQQCFQVARDSMETAKGKLQTIANTLDKIRDDTKDLTEVADNTICAIGVQLDKLHQHENNTASKESMDTKAIENLKKYMSVDDKIIKALKKYIIEQAVRHRAKAVADTRGYFAHISCPYKRPNDFELRSDVEIRPLNPKNLDPTRINIESVPVIWTLDVDITEANTSVIVHWEVENWEENRAHCPHRTGCLDDPIHIAWLEEPVRPFIEWPEFRSPPPKEEFEFDAIVEIEGRGQPSRYPQESDFNEYQEASKKFLQRNPGDEATIVFCLALGLCGEAGEVADHIKKMFFYEGHDWGVDELVDELGDTLWYLTRVASEFGIPLQKIVDRNLEKLTAKYPEGVDVLGTESKNNET